MVFVFRDYPLLFQFLSSTWAAAMTAKVCMELIYILPCSFILTLSEVGMLIIYSLTLTAELPLEFPDGTTPVTCRVSIYDSSVDSKVGVGSLMDKASAPPLSAGSTYMEEVHAKV